MGKYGPEKASYLDTFYAVCGAKRESGIENMKERHLFVLFITKILPIFNHKYNLWFICYVNQPKQMQWKFERSKR